MVTEDDCIRALREAAQILGKSPTKAEYEDLDITPSASTILRHCGGWNDAKEQAGLETAYSTGSRVEPKPDDVELPDGLVWEELSQDQRWHYKNREWNGQRTLKRRQKRKEWAYQMKAERGCQQCGLADGTCLEFHHKPGTDKQMKISDMVNGCYSKDRIMAEIEKCEVLCVNCHRKEHGQTPEAVPWIRETVMFPWERDAEVTEARWVPDETRRQRAWVHEFKRFKGCTRCGEANPVCLDLHHTGQLAKACSISQLISRGCSGAELKAELGKCEVLCANCHRKEHYREPDPEQFPEGE